MVMTWKSFLCNVSWKPAVCTFQRVELSPSFVPRRELGVAEMREKERVQIVESRGGSLLVHLSPSTSTAKAFADIVN